MFLMKEQLYFPDFPALSYGKLLESVYLATGAESEMSTLQQITLPFFPFKTNINPVGSKSALFFLQMQCLTCPS